MSAERLMTYAELADHFGIQVSSAKKRAMRKKWRRVQGNDGLMRVSVPVEDMSALVRGDVRGDVPGNSGVSVSSPVISDLQARLAYLEGLSEGLKGELEAERRRADAAEARAQEVGAERDAWRQHAQRSFWERLFGKGE